MQEVRLIDANALDFSYENVGGTADECSADDVKAYIASAPTIEAEPVRHGRWVFRKGDNKETVDGWICTACEFGFHTKVPYFEVFKYCPMCGARMDGGADNG